MSGETRSAAGPLTGTRVLDLVDGAGTYGPWLLAGLGAEVIRIEPPGGAPHRQRAPFYEAPESPQGAATSSLYFLHYNCGKLGVTLDTNAPGGRDLLQRLLETADVVIDNGNLAQQGFDLEALTATRPLVVVSITPFGLSGPRAGWLGDDLVIQAMSGMMHLYGPRDERPARFAPEQAAEMSGAAAAAGALIALFGVRRSGRGRGEVVEIVMERVCALSTLHVSNASLYRQHGLVQHRRTREQLLYGNLYEARDGFIFFRAYRDLAALRRLLADSEEQEAAHVLQTVASDGRPLRDEALQAALERFAGRRTRAEVTEEAQRHGVICLPVNDVADLVQDPFLQQRAFFAEVSEADLEVAWLDIAAPVRLSGAQYRPGRRPPLLGEHNQTVYGGLGLSPDALDRLHEQGTI